MFYSDNTSPAHPEIIGALLRGNTGRQGSYGGDEFAAIAETRLREVFETDCDVFLVSSGTAANAISVAALTPAWGSILCHCDSHLAVMEGGAPEFFAGGAKMLPLNGVNGVIAPRDLDELLEARPKNVHVAPPRVLSISQANEYGVTYAVTDIGEIGEICRRRGLKLHMDGARLANALAALRTSPAEMTWKQGVNMLSFGVTKNGGLACEAIVCFDKSAAVELPRIRKRGAHLLSKHRYLAVQVIAYLEDDSWLTWASHANAAAARLASLLVSAGAELLYPLETNAVFVRMPDSVAMKLRTVMGPLHDWPPAGAGAYRFVTGWDASDADFAAITRALAD